MQIDSSALRGEPYDLIVVGSGPAGLTLARKHDALSAGRTLIVESGHREDPGSSARKLSAVDASGDLPADDYPEHNQRVFGGTSSVWHGLCAVLEKRSFLNREWPFPYDDLHEWYPEAAKILNLPEEAHAFPEMAFPDNPNVVYKPYYFADPVPRFADLFGDWLARSETASVLFNHTVTNVGIRNGAASSVFIRESAGGGRTSVEMFGRRLRLPSFLGGGGQVPVEVFGRRIVLAAGGIQNARLLQLSLPENSGLPAGRYFCEHPHYWRCAELILDWEKFRKMMSRIPSGRPVLPAISLSSEFSHAHGLVSAAFAVTVGDKVTRTLTKNLFGRRRKVLSTQTTIRAEMRADGGNRVTLSESRKDALGQPVAHVALKFDSRETQAVHRHLASQLIRSGLGRMGPFRQVEILGGGHMMGTTRMGSDPTLSVTDAQGRVHGVRNLYVAGSSLFPAAAAANPTFTIVALSLRLAAHLARGGG